MARRSRELDDGLENDGTKDWFQEEESSRRMPPMTLTNALRNLAASSLVAADPMEFSLTASRYASTKGPLGFHIHIISAQEESLVAESTYLRDTRKPILHCSMILVEECRRLQWVEEGPSQKVFDLVLTALNWSQLPLVIDIITKTKSTYGGVF